MAAPSQQTPKKGMPYVRLGKSGLKVSKIILGTMSYGSKDWQDWVLEEEEGIKHIKAAYDAGIQTFDTADAYSNGVSEVILGKAIKQHNFPRDEIVVMTKVYSAIGRTPGVNFLRSGEKPDEVGYVNQRGLSRKHIFDGVHASLHRLQLDYIDVLQCHRFDYETPIEETMQALHDVVQAGLVRYIGMSSCWAYQFHAMQNYAILKNLTPFVSMQNQHSLVYREEEREMFPTCQLFGVGIIPFSPLGRGYLTRPISEQTLRGNTDMIIGKYDKNHPNNRVIVQRLEEVAKKLGKSMAQVALAWSLQKGGVSAPIVGTTSLENLKQLIDAVHLELSKEDVEYLEAPYQPQSVIGHS